MSVYVCVGLWPIKQSAYVCVGLAVKKAPTSILSKGMLILAS